jgi:predicted enzyme related to lactoylglutathione lyase
MNRVTHFEIPADDPDRAMRFYEKAFNWQFTQFGDQSYWMARTGDAGDPGIDGAVTKKNHPDQPLTNNIQVADLDESIAKVEALGGVLVVPKTQIPGVGWFCFFKDTEGNIMGMMQELG